MVQKNSLGSNVLVIVGPTASGKSSFALECAKRLQGVIISCDSMQVYQEMSIGTAKPTLQEMQEVEHKLIGTHSVKQQFSAADFKKLASNEIDHAIARGKLPIIVGGTGLFLQALMYNFDFNQVKSDELVRKQYESILSESGLTALYEILKQKSPQRASQIHPNDTSRILRALEVLDEKPDFAPKREPNTKYNFLVFGTNLPREQLYERINLRVDQMIEQGLLTEMKQLLDQGLEQDLLKIKAIGYKELLPYFKGEKPLKECADLLKQKTRNYAKRQITWFKTVEGILWFDPIQEKEETMKKIKELVKK